MSPVGLVRAVYGGTGRKRWTHDAARGRCWPTVVGAAADLLSAAGYGSRG